MGLPVKKIPEGAKKEKKRYIRKHKPLYEIVNKIKLWPSKLGILHGIKKVSLKGSHIEIETHCGHQIIIRNSRKGRAGRWLRNKWYVKPCPKCKVPQWKISKFSATSFG